MTDGDNLRRRTTLSDDTLMQYLSAAAQWLKVRYGILAPIYDHSALVAKPRLIPFLAEILRQRRTWREPQQKKEPYTGAMFQVLHREIGRAYTVDRQAHLDVQAAVFDWARLGVFTGSRLSEYAQSKTAKGKLYATIPDSAAAGRWRGQPIAFIYDDFMFYSEGRISVSYLEALRSGAEELHIRFRFDKSKENFTVRKFRRNHGHYLCPVKAALSILERAQTLNVLRHFPIEVYRVDMRGNYRFLTGQVIIKVMRGACVAAHQNPQHYMRLNVNRIVSHSNRVTAAVALHNAGVPVEDITFRLRWNSDAVSFYLRECFKNIGMLSASSLIGVLDT
ncbi:MAG: hypothetical protein ACREBR_02575 [bacterium]